MAYFDDFSVAQDPIAGFWTPCRNTNRAQVLTTGGNAFGKGTNNDGYAYVLGAGDSVIETTVFRSGSLLDTEPNSYEIEHLHRLTDDTGTTTAYEVDMGYAGGGITMVRWSGATSFAVLSGVVTDHDFFPDGAGGQLRHGNKIKTELVLLPTPRINIYADVGSGYVLYLHYVLGADTTNDLVPLASGDPGIGFFTTLGSSNLLGMQDATITPAAASAFPTSQPTRGGRGVGKGPSGRRMAPQRFPDTIPFVQDSSAQSVSFRRGMGPRMRFRLAQRFPSIASAAYSLPVTTGTYALTGVAAPLQHNDDLVATTGTYTLTGVAAPLLHGYLIAPAKGAYVLNGVAVTFPRGYVLTATRGIYSLNGVVLNLLVGRLVSAASGAYVLAGISDSFLRGYAVAPSSGPYTLVGNTATLTYSGANASPSPTQNPFIASAPKMMNRR